MRKIIPIAERIRNDRIRELYSQREKVQQNRDLPPQIKKLTQDQMDEVIRLRDKEGMSREDAVKLVLSKS